MHERRPLGFSCGGNRLQGVLDVPAGAAQRGVLFIVGGPQYRAGSHRQFTLLAREFATHGIAAMRFDYRGMGDSEGAARGFDDIGEDVRAATDAFFASIPAMRELFLFGLCDGASAAVLHAASDPRVHGLVLVNPWVRTESGAAQATLKHYYPARLAEPALWKKIFSGSFDFRAAARSLRLILSQSRVHAAHDDLPTRLGARLRHFKGGVLIILAGADLTAQEFSSLAATPTWSSLIKHRSLICHTVPKADHTFSQPEWHDEMARVATQFLLGE